LSVLDLSRSTMSNILSHATVECWSNHVYPGFFAKSRIFLVLVLFFEDLESEFFNLRMCVELIVTQLRLIQYYDCHASLYAWHDTNNFLRILSSLYKIIYNFFTQLQSKNKVKDFFSNKFNIKKLKNCTYVRETTLDTIGHDFIQLRLTFHISG